MKAIDVFGWATGVAVILVCLVCLALVMNGLRVLVLSLRRELRRRRHSEG